MKRVAVFGNAGAGKSTLAKRLAAIAGLPLYPIDMMEFRAGGDAVPRAEFEQAHAELLRKEAWVIDGFGGKKIAWERFAVADTLVYIDLPVALHYWWVTKRLLKAPFVWPEGWPRDSPLWNSTLHALKIVGLCHRNLTPEYRQLVAEMAATKRVHHLRSRGEMRTFLEAVKREYQTAAI